MTTAVPASNVVTLNTDIQNGNVAALNTVMMLESYKGVKFTLEMKMTYNLILSFTRTGKRAEFSQSYLAAYLSCSRPVANRAVTALKALGLVAADPDNRGRGDVDLLEALPIVVEFAKSAEVKRVNNRKSKGNKNAASRPVGKGKPQLHVVQDQEQPDDDHSGDAGDHVQHDVTDSEQPDVMPEPTETTEPQDEGETVDCILPVDDSDRDDSDAVKESEPDQLDQQIAAANLHGVQYDLTEIMRHCQGSRVKAAMRLQAEIGVTHRQRILEAQGAVQVQPEASNNDSYDDGYSIDDDWNPEDGDAY
ncbi:helix-turn-helix domain-containing protein [Serratia marcescens]|uniref:helix-turn-helix domain-containing protein n=1 Tax=Serratia marcescens TaxID=615 RepID=UPI001F149A0F|nr:helix-turn-helix domain-containing protein [Serratia marcescens]MBN5205018.1 winged helix-turn-helix domain-containing protein [Serratia marcescens]MDP8729477.1 helix-turn-helix domain-containing protein [Serratia marcescens]HEI9833578.1 winged helix-turn-helix domain-containing protein [Serratia marcescens]